MITSPAHKLEVANVSWLAGQLDLSGWRTLLGTFSVNTTTEVLTVSKDHQLVKGERVMMTNAGGGLPSPGSASPTYFVKTTPAARTLTVSAALDGNTVDFTTAGTGTHSLRKLNIHEGRSSGKLTAGRRLIVSASREGGALVHAGIYDVMLELIVETAAKEQAGDTVTPLAWHENAVETLVYLYRHGQQATVGTALNGIDSTLVTPGWWVEERRDEPTKDFFVTVLPLRWSVSVAVG